MANLSDERSEIPEDLERYLIMLERLVTDPGRFFTHEWPDSEWRAKYAHIQPEFLWVDTLSAWAMWHGWERMLIHSGDAFKKAHAEWSYRPELLEVLEIGRASILNTLTPLTGIPLDSDVREIADQFADKWAVTDGAELAAAALEARFNRTNVAAFVLAEIDSDDVRRLTGKVHYHVTGDPRNADLQTFMKHVDEWAAMMTGLQLSRGGRPKLELTASQIIQAFKEESTFVDASKLSVANNLSISVDTLNRRLKEHGLAWPPIDQ